MRRDQFNAEFGQLSVKWVTVICLITNQLFRLALDMSRWKSLLYQLDFVCVWRSRHNVQGETSTSSVRFAQTSYTDTAMTLLPKEPLAAGGIGHRSNGR